MASNSFVREPSPIPLNQKNKAYTAKVESDPVLRKKKRTKSAKLLELSKIEEEKLPRSDDQKISFKCGAPDGEKPTP